RLVNSLDEQSGDSIEQVLNTPSKAEAIISVCDRLLVSLEATKTDIQQMRSLLSVLQTISEPSTETPEL
ncbi:MAG: MerR family transcriptional regulator, partial [Spirochaetales bacterium]|nr:MerR family transcriptional regulator [Spirochaetales bacterium]